MSDVTIRPAVGDDLEAVVEVGRRTWPETYEPIAGTDYVAMGLAKWWTPEANIPAIRTGRAVVAELDGQVVGMASTGPLDGHQVLWKLYVLPDHHGRGIGSQLLSAAVERIRRTDPEAPELQVSFTEGNLAAREFYLAKGFTVMYREPGHDPIPDQIWMRLDLSGAEADAGVNGYRDTLAAEEQPAGVPE